MDNPFSPEWTRKTRVDFRSTGKPLPDSPLVTLKPHKPKPQGNLSSGGER